MNKKGKCLIFSAPSGSGKTTIVQHLLNVRSDLRFSISAATRPPREGEADGMDYYFLDVEDFQEKIKSNDLLEWEEVYPGRFYGTLKSEIDRIHNEGNHVVFDVDVVGGANLKKIFGNSALAVFIRVSDLGILKNRLESRGTDDTESINTRLSKARDEMEFESQFDVSIINDDLTTAFQDTEKVVENFLSRS